MVGIIFPERNRIKEREKKIKQQIGRKRDSIQMIEIGSLCYSAAYFFSVSHSILPAFTVRWRWKKDTQGNIVQRTRIRMIETG